MKWIAAFLLGQALLFFASSATGANTRLAIGTLGLTPENRNAALADIVASQLSTAPGLDLVERRELNAVLREASLGLSGIVRAKDAVRIGAMVRADQFLLGSSISVNGTNRLIVRLVDARTGIIRSVGVFRDNPKLEILAADIAEFAREEIKHPLQEHRDFLAIGVIQNLGVNNRFSEFPAQMRGSVAATLGRKVTVLERDIISFLADEVRMDIAGLTESQGKQSQQMQFGFWIVDGFYQSYEIAEPEVQLRLRVERVLGRQRSFMIQGKPTEQYFAKICQTIERAINEPAEAGQIVPPTRKGEVEALESRAKQLVDYRPIWPTTPPIYPRSIWIRTADNPDKRINALDEATRVFESILLLDPENNAAKMQLAGCLIYTGRESGPGRAIKPEKKARAADFFREVIATGDAEYADDARISLALLCDWIEGINMLHQFELSAVDRPQKERFRYHRNDMLRLAERRVPVDAVIPCVRAQLLDELTELKNSTNEPVSVSFDTVLFGLRFDPAVREEIINALLPELLDKFPDLKPHILLAAAGEQTTTDSPVSMQFFASLKECEGHPEGVWRSSSYFRHLSSTIEEEKDVREHGGCTLYQRTFDNRQYATVLTAALARQRASEKGLAPPLTTVGKMHLAESYMGLKKWKEALDVFDEVPGLCVQQQNECRRHLGVATESEKVRFTEGYLKTLNDMEKVELAYQCIERRQFSTAMAILESMGYRTVRMNRDGPWGDAFAPVLPAIVADECRAKAGKSPIKDPIRFELGETPYITFIRDGLPRWFSIEPEGEDLWMGIYNQIKMFRGNGPFAAAKPTELHEFERTTQTETTCVCISRNYIWAGTFDDGVLEFNRSTKACRRLTMKDGLLLNGISGLKLQGQTLWIAYRNGANGAIGTLDVSSHKFSSLTPILSLEAGSNSQPHNNQALSDDLHQAPSLPISSIAAGEAGETWFAVNEKGLQRFRNPGANWDTPLQMPPRNSYFPAMVANTMDGLLLLANRDVLGEWYTSGGLVIYDYRQNRRSVMQIRDGLPSNDLTAVAVDGKIAWVGGRGFVAVVDVQERKVLRIAYVSASRIASIQLGKVHAWVQVACAESADPDYTGNASTGVYRLTRSTIEPVVYAAKRN